jgi:hypothetical protein
LKGKNSEEFGRTEKNRSENPDALGKRWKGMEKDG